MTNFSALCVYYFFSTAPTVIINVILEHCISHPWRCEYDFKSNSKLLMEKTWLRSTNCHHVINHPETLVKYYTVAIYAQIYMWKCGVCIVGCDMFRIHLKKGLETSIEPCHCHLVDLPKPFLPKQDGPEQC